MLVEEMKTQLKSAMKDPTRQVERDTLRYVLGTISTKENDRVQGGKPLTERQIVSVLEQTLQGNLELVRQGNEHGKDVTNLQQNEVLQQLLPQKLTAEKVSEVLQSQREQILAVANVNLAMRVAMPLFAGQLVDGNLVRQVLQSMRDNVI